MGRGDEHLSDDVMKVERALRRLSRGAHIARLHRCLNAAAGVDLDRPAYIALSCLTEQGPLPVSALAEVSGVEVSTMSRLVDRLLAGGLVAARRAATDQRVTVVELTPAGDHLVTQLRAVRRAALRDLLADWTAAEQAQFARLLDRFVLGIETLGAPTAGRRTRRAGREREEAI